MDKQLKINFLDHVAIKVKDMELSAQWYEKTLQLKRYELPEWKPFPIFLLSGKIGVAIFPAQSPQKLEADIRIDHFAFNVDQENFQLAQERFHKLEIPYDFQDHHYFHSIYLRDPDGHKVELMTLVVSEASFY